MHPPIAAPYLMKITQLHDDSLHPSWWCADSIYIITQIIPYNILPHPNGSYIQQAYQLIPQSKLFIGLHFTVNSI